MLISRKDLIIIADNGQGFVQWPIGVTKSRVRNPHRRLKLLFKDNIQKRPCQPDMLPIYILSMMFCSDGHCTKPAVNCCDMVPIQKNFDIRTPLSIFRLTISAFPARRRPY